jgi:hypothetical protein
MMKSQYFNHILFIKVFVIVLHLIALSNWAYAQKEGVIWYFGNNAGLNFMTNPPTPLTDGQLSTNEGCLSISDGAGNLLFYSDGSSIWDRNHQLMPSIPIGGLGGDNSSSQSGIVIPDPGNPNQYYVFTVDLLASGPIYWAKVDMTLNGGNGDIISSKNKLLDLPCEKIAAFGNCNTNEYWVVGHKFLTDSFFAWKVTSAGILPPVTTKIGTNIVGTTSATQGYLKFSPNGKKIAAAHALPINRVEIFDFDINTFQPNNRYF